MTMLRQRKIGYILAILIFVALIGWLYYTPSKDLASYIRDVIFILSVLVAVVVYYDWQRSNIDTRWWIWDIAFWNKKGVTFSNYKLPAIIIYLTIVNPDIFTIIIDKINLTIHNEKNTKIKYKLTEYAFGDEQSFKPRGRVSGEIPRLQYKSRFSPIIIKPRSEKIRWIIFMSQTDEPDYKKLENMLSEGKYESRLELMTLRGDPILVKFGFSIDNSCIRDYDGGSWTIDYRNIIKAAKHDNFHKNIEKVRKFIRI